MPYRERTYDAAAKSAMVFPVCYRMEGRPGVSSAAQLTIKGWPTHKQSGHCDIAESSSHGVIFCSAAGCVTPST